jgi:hypothetical protein
MTIDNILWFWEGSSFQKRGGAVTNPDYVGEAVEALIEK